MTQNAESALHTRISAAFCRVAKGGNIVSKNIFLKSRAPARNGGGKLCPAIQNPPLRVVFAFGAELGKGTRCAFPLHPSGEVCSARHPMQCSWRSHCIPPRANDLPFDHKAEEPSSSSRATMTERAFQSLWKP